MFRGNFPAKIDEKGRLKAPSDFRAVIAEKYGSELFVTSLYGDSVWIYPLPRWIALEERLATKAPSLHPVVEKFRNRVNYFGQQTSMDSQGRILIQPLLREHAGIDGEVVVLGFNDHLVVWNRAKFEKSKLGEDFAREDRLALSDLGI
jgi:MraZ protein